ncbi:hypothetical protein [Roseovarius sp. MMSF_3281]|uniref:hypothetical protein n=1 Tax=Roseovarius sp. MMSF_3281 TaxID=3046694 RepID=UPI00273F84FB|nr:hypothetical protein [Roseovarius sp. MMSF_3281]
MTRSEVRKLARRGKLIDESFKVFQRTVYPGAPDDQVQAMRICFFAGAAELFALMHAGLDDGLSETDGDLAFMEQWVNELERFHKRTNDTMTAGGRQQ